MEPQRTQTAVRTSGLGYLASSTRSDVFCGTWNTNQSVRARFCLCRVHQRSDRRSEGWKKHAHMVNVGLCDAWGSVSRTAVRSKSSVVHLRAIVGEFSRSDVGASPERAFRPDCIQRKVYADAARASQIPRSQWQRNSRYELGDAIKSLERLSCESSG